MQELQQAFQTINWGLIAPLILIQLVLMVIAVIDLIKIKDTNGPKWVWLLVVLFINVIGPIIYFIFGRRQNG
ncbi:PLD nuclease N-terminal domain-containing protein [Rossellomorea aquimaris]|uniref:PLD nuclease N-terminal domain-containing protein n=1 Tax=Rossellomorea aquimaris TaxID=189382 RepID=UPI001CD33392|nr:PLD nuclease N-terminal domain-containing protein [Rossellomorea aquimaris]MCA1054496.1 PLD nuclease N-terminal domain-containing protein [Rossellomorea aquimaris]